MNATTMMNITKAELLKWKNLTYIHVLGAIGVVFSFLVTMTIFRVARWQVNQLNEAEGLFIDTSNMTFVTGQQAVVTYQTLGILLLSIGIAAITAHEYKSRAHVNTFIYAPQRNAVAAAQLISGFAYALMWTFLMIFAGFIAAKMFGPENFINNYHIIESNLRRIAVFTYTALLLTLIVQGLALITRSTAIGAMGFVLYMFLGENIIGQIPKIGSHILPYLPMKSMGWLWMGYVPQGYKDATNLPIAFGIITLTAVVIYGIGLYFHNKRDA